ncbi:Uncharacterised protein [Klebsiella pneumoniae]|nr:Uncharacterised protein [Klebsiella pneumoniae]
MADEGSALMFRNKLHLLLLLYLVMHKNQSDACRGQRDSFYFDGGTVVQLRNAGDCT